MNVDRKALREAALQARDAKPWNAIEAEEVLHDALTPRVVVSLLDRLDRYERALEKAAHDLSSAHGLYATDIAPENRDALTANGHQIEWQTDFAATIDAIRDALSSEAQS